MSNKLISLLHATRGRAEKAQACRDNWLNTATDPNSVQHIFAIDDDDTASLTGINTERVITPRGKGCVAAWNAAAVKCTGDILVQMSDDWAPVQGWDAIIRKEFDGCEEERVLAISDGHRKDDLLCMAILNRKRYEKQGFMFHPKFVSVFSDDYFTWAAKKDGVLKDAKHIVFEHEHPVFGKAAMDATYEANNAPERYANGHVTFNELTRPDNAKVCLTMIVKNEIHNMKRCLESVKDVIQYWVICDTGSTDGTQQFIKDLMAEWNIPGELHECPWVDFATNRTESLKLARSKAEYSLVIDADDYLEFSGPKEVLNNLKHDQYHMRIVHGGLTYYRPQIVCNMHEWKYVGVLHEFLSGPEGVRMAPPIMLDTVTVRASASDTRNGFSGSKKYISDALVLEKALLAEGIDAGLKTRYTFYQAQSYRDAGMHERSLKAYQERVDLGGWDEEVYYSMYMVARMKVALNYKEEEIIDALIKAWEYRPSRVDALYDLIRYLGEKNRFTLAFAFATIGIRIPPTKDILFVRQDIHQWRMLEDYSILAMRTGNKTEAVNSVSALINSPLFDTIVPADEQERIKKNLEAFKNSP
jgi:glycosyltransferase involved in cell wall biosynthesis